MDDETTQADTTVTVTETPPAPRKPTRDRREFSIDAASMAVKCGDYIYAIDRLAEGVVTHLTLRGLAVTLRDAQDPAQAYAKLLDGKIPARATASTPKLSKSRQAILEAMVAEAVKSQAVPGMKKDARDAMAAAHRTDMTPIVAAMTRAKVDALSGRRDVTDQFRKLFGPAEDATPLSQAIA